MATTTAVEVQPVTRSVGAVIEGVDLRQPLDPETVGLLHRALIEHGVILFRDQDLSADQMKAFAGNFGTPVPEPSMAADAGAEPVGEADLQPTKSGTSVWHSDTTFVPEPPMATALRAVQLPPVGGDTCWASMYAAYDRLSEPMRAMVDGLSAVHSMVPLLHRMGQFTAERADALAQRDGVEIVHPVIRVHPETGRNAIFVNESSTTRIVELTPAESAHVLALLFEHVKSPDFMMRWRWTPNDVALWDNRAVQHYAVPDYDTTRVMQRVVLAGDRPRGPQ